MLKIKALALSTLAVGLLFGMQSAYAQPGKSSVTEGHRSFAIPKLMEVEHEELHSALAKLTKAGGRTGEAAQTVAELLDHHFTKENEYALPPLSLLIPLSQGRFECRMTDVLPLTDKLEADMPTMLSEHRDITAALIKLKNAATSEDKLAGVQFAEHLAAHAQTEEQVTYPTALLIGVYVKSRATQCADETR